MIEVSTSVLSIKEKEVTTFYDLEVAGTNYFHIDVMDGKFVKNNTEDKMLEYSTTLNHITNIGLDIHLMCENIEKFIDDYIMFEPDSITFHIEAIKNKEQVISVINDLKNENIKVGIAINPDTELEKIFEYLPIIHKVLVMTVVPGEGGQQLISSTIEKIKKLKKYIIENNLETIIEVDGGINSENVTEVVNAGAEIIVSGSYIIKATNKKDAINSLKNV